MTATSTLCQEPSTRLHNAIGVIGRVLVSVALVLILLNPRGHPFRDMVVFFLPPQPGQHQRAARAPRSVALSPMASKIPKSMAVTWFRASAEQEPVVIFSCILGGLGEGAPFSLSRPHPTPPQEPYSSDLLPASTPPLPGAQASSSPTQSAPHSKALRPLFEGGTHMHMRHAAHLHFPDALPRCTPAPPASLPRCNTRPSLLLAFILSPQAPPLPRQASLCRSSSPTAAAA